jgi:hypothetical protein
MGKFGVRVEVWFKAGVNFEIKLEREANRILARGTNGLREFS